MYFTCAATVRFKSESCPLASFTRAVARMVRIELPSRRSMSGARAQIRHQSVQSRLRQGPSRRSRRISCTASGDSPIAASTAASAVFHPIAAAARRHGCTNHYRRNPINSAVGQFVNFRIGEAVTMLDGIHAGAQCCGDAVGADCVSGDAMAEAVRFINDRARFVVGEVHNAVQDAIGFVVIAVVGVILDPVGTVGKLLAHCETRALDAIHRLHAVRQFEFPRKSEQRIHAGGCHGARGDKHPRPGHFAAIDGGLHIHVGIHCAFGFKIAQRREAVIERDFRVAGRKDGAIRD